MRIFSLFFAILPMLSFGQIGSIDSSKMLKEVHIQSVRVNSKMNTTSNLIKIKDVAHLNLGQDIPTLLQQLPAVNTSSDAGNGIGYSYLYIRGMDAQRIQVNINGIPYNDAESQEVYWVNIPDLMSSADDIQIQRGIGFSSMGGTGLGGTVSIKTTKKYQSPFVSLNSSIGSFNTYKTSLNLSTGLLKDGWQVTARGSLMGSNGYIDRGWSKLGSMYLDISKYGEKFASHLIASHGQEQTYQAWYGLSQDDYNKGLLTKNIAGTDYEYKTGAPYPNQTDNYRQSHLQWINNFLWRNGHHSSVSAYFTKGKGYYEEYKVGENYENYSSQISGTGDLVRQLWLNNYLVGLNASHIIEKSNWTNTTGLSANRYYGYHFGTIRELLAPYTGTLPNEFYHNESVKTDLTAFNKSTYSYAKSNFVLDLQLRNVIYTAQGIVKGGGQINFDKNFLFFNPKLGWNMEVNKHHKIYAFAGMSHREPVRSDFVDEDNIRQPKPEQVYDIELGYQNTSKNTLFKANLFGMYFIDQLIPTGNVNSVGSPIRENVAKSYRAGAEAEFQYSISKQFALNTNQYLALNKILDYSNYLITYNEDYSINESKTIVQNFSSTNIAFSPSWISYTELAYSPFIHTKLRLMNKIVSTQYLDNTSSDAKSLPLYSFTNFSISHKLKFAHFLKEMDLNLLLNNIFNQKYISRGYTYFSGNTANADGTVTQGVDYNYYFPQAGFNFLFGVNMKW